MPYVDMYCTRKLTEGLLMQYFMRVVNALISLQNFKLKGKVFDFH